MKLKTTPLESYDQPRCSKKQICSLATEMSHLAKAMDFSGQICELNLHKAEH